MLTNLPRWLCRCRRAFLQSHSRAHRPVRPAEQTARWDCSESRWSASDEQSAGMPRRACAGLDTNPHTHVWQATCPAILTIVRPAQQMDHWGCSESRWSASDEQSAGRPRRAYIGLDTKQIHTHACVTSKGKGCPTIFRPFRPAEQTAHWGCRENQWIASGERSTGRPRRAYAGLDKKQIHTHMCVTSKGVKVVPWSLEQADLRQSTKKESR